MKIKPCDIIYATSALSVGLILGLIKKYYIPEFPWIAIMAAIVGVAVSMVSIRMKGFEKEIAQELIVELIKSETITSEHTYDQMFNLDTDDDAHHNPWRKYYIELKPWAMEFLKGYQEYHH